MAVLNESTGNSQAIDGAVAPVVWWCVHLDFLLRPGPHTLMLHLEVHGLTFVGRDGFSGAPSLGRCAAMVAGQGIGFQDSSGQVIRGPGI